jgi:hypothetical protein
MISFICDAWLTTAVLRAVIPAGSGEECSSTSSILAQVLELSVIEAQLGRPPALQTR